MKIVMFVFAVCAQEYVHTSIFGNTHDLGYYYVDLWVGSPPMKQTVIIDTGSRLTAFPCIGCTDCGTHMDKYFDYKNSSTSKPVLCDAEKKCYGCSKSGDQCRYSVAYAEGSSISGILMQDFIIFGDDFEHSHKVFMTFGCHRRETHLFRTQLADGIMGLGSANGDRSTVVELMYKDHDVSALVFTICFAHDGGFMTVGGFNASRHNAAIKWTKLFETPYYGVVAKGLKVNGQDTGLEREDFTEAYTTGSIVDSGTTFTYLCYRVYSTMFEYLTQFCKEKDKCWGDRVRVAGEPHLCFVYNEKVHKSKEKFFESFPVITFVFDDIHVDWHPNRYLFAWPETPKTYCVGAYNNGGSGNVLGGIFMRGHDVVFDKGNGKIGFALSDCEFKNKENTTFVDDREENKEQVKASEGKRNLGLILAAGFLLLAVVVAVFFFVRRRMRKSEYLKFGAPQYTPEASVANVV